MSRSVLIRLVVVSLVVATCSIAATAWLTTTSTRAQFTGDLERTLEGDNNIYNTLVDFSRTHPTWDGVHAVLDSLNTSTDRTITLAAADASVIASSDPQQQRAPAGAVATAVVDPLASAVALPTATIPVAEKSLQEAEIADPVVEPEPAAAETAPLGVDRASRDLEPPSADVTMARVIVPELDPTLPPPAFFLDDRELADRRQQINDAAACMSRVAGIEVREAAGDFGGYVLEPTSLDDLIFEKAAYACPTPLADRPGQRYISINSLIVDQTVACLKAADVDVLVSPTKSNLRVVSVRTMEGGSPTETTAAGCRSNAVRAAMAPYTVPVAQLYLTSPPQPTPGWLSSAGGARIVLALVLVLVVTLLAAAFGARRLLRPIRSLTRAAQRMATGELTARVLVRGNDEIARLGTAFNTMAESVENNEHQRKVLVSDIAHELRNPLANVRGYLEGAQDDLVRLDGDLVESLLEETLHLQHLIDDLQDLALADAGRLLMHTEPTDVTALVERVVAAHRGAAETAGITISFLSGPPSAVLTIDPVRIRQAVGNLVANAIRYTPPGGSIDVGVQASSADSTLTIEVADTGTGISREDLPHLFDRFFRADTSRSRATGGSGLGLAITRHLVEAHGGTIEVRSALGLGSQFKVVLPAPDLPAREALTPPAAVQIEAVARS